MKQHAFLFTALLLTAPLVATAQDDSSNALDDASSTVLAGTAGREVTDSEMDLSSAGNLAGVSAGSGPIAFGVVYSNGSKQSGTSNWSSTYNSTYRRYEIAISGQSYYYLSYSTLITPAGDRRICRSSSVGGKLLVYCHDQTGAAQPARFGFVTFKN